MIVHSIFILLEPGLEKNLNSSSPFNRLSVKQLPDFAYKCKFNVNTQGVLD